MNNLLGKEADFNPRLPRGRRLYGDCGNFFETEFQSTPPSREATDFCNTGGVIYEFQSTPPSREAT